MPKELTCKFMQVFFFYLTVNHNVGNYCINNFCIEIVYQGQKVRLGHNHNLKKVMLL